MQEFNKPVPNHPVFNKPSQLNLYDVINNSYNPNPNKFQGYEYDSALSNKNQQTYYNPTENKLLISYTGTHNLSDWGTNVALATGHLKDTKRYKEAQQTYDLAKQKYAGADTTIAGHSLGGQLASSVAHKGDKVYTLDKASLPFQGIKSNETAYRSAGDVVSAFGIGAKRMKTLAPNSSYSFLLPTSIGKSVKNALEAHKVKQIKEKNIFI
jgi:hypothetical protein